MESEILSPPVLDLNHVPYFFRQIIWSTDEYQCSLCGTSEGVIVKFFVPLWSSLLYSSVERNLQRVKNFGGKNDFNFEIIFVEHSHTKMKFRRTLGDKFGYSRLTISFLPVQKTERSN